MHWNTAEPLRQCIVRKSTTGPVSHLVKAYVRRLIGHAQLEDTRYNVGLRRRDCMTFQAKLLVKHLLLTRLLLECRRPHTSQYHISCYLTFVTFVVPCAVFVSCASWKIQYDVYTQLP
jgi:hypothetical protein